MTPTVLLTSIHPYFTPRVPDRSLDEQCTNILRKWMHEKYLLRQAIHPTAPRRQSCNSLHTCPHGSYRNRKSGTPARLSTAAGAQTRVPHPTLSAYRDGTLTRATSFMPSASLDEDLGVSQEPIAYTSLKRAIKKLGIKIGRRAYFANRAAKRLR